MRPYAAVEDIVQNCLVLHQRQPFKSSGAAAHGQDQVFFPNSRIFYAGGDMPDVDVVVNGEYVRQHLGEDGKVMDMKRYIL